MMGEFSGIFKNRYPLLKNRDWVRTLSSEDLKVFIDIGNQANGYGKMGGMTRASKAKRDSNGKFISNKV